MYMFDEWKKPRQNLFCDIVDYNVQIMIKTLSDFL